MFLALAAVISLTVVWLLFSHTGQPRYEGRPLSYWFKEFCASGQLMSAYNDRTRQDSSEALQKIGTNAVPYLVERSFDTNSDSAARRNFYRLFNSLHFKPLPPFVPVEIMAEEAPDAVREIKPPAVQLLSLMQRQLTSTNPTMHLTVLYLLGAAGDGSEQGVPYLVAALKDHDLVARRIAMQSLGWLGPKARDAVPALIEVMKSEKGGASFLEQDAAVALGGIGSNAAPAFPFIKDLFERQTNWNLRCTLAAKLVTLDPTQTEPLHFLIDGLANHQPGGDRWMAAANLRRIGTNAKSAIPALVAAIQTATNELLLSEASSAARALGAPKEAYLPALKARMTANDETGRVNAAARILDADPADHDAQAVLINMIKTNSMFAEYAIGALGRAGPEAKQAIPVLKNALKDKHGDIRDAASWALKRIQAAVETK